MALLSQVGTFGTTTSTGSQVVSLDAGRWSGKSPKVGLYWGTSATSDGVGVHANLGFGCAISSSSRAAISFHSVNAISNSNANRRHSNLRCISRITASGATQEAADFNAYGANQLDLNFTDADASARLMNFAVLGGDIDAHLKQITSPATSGVVNYTGVPFDADCLIGFSANNDVATPNTEQNCYMTIGVYDKTTNAKVSIFIGNATSPSTACKRRQSTVGFLGYVALQDALAVGTTSDGYAIDWTVTDPYAAEHWILALKGVRAKVVIGNQPTSDTTVVRPIGFAPKVALCLTAMAPSSATLQNDARIGFGAWDSGNNMSYSGAVDEAGQATTDADHIQSSTHAIRHINHEQTLVGSCAVSASADGTDLVETWTNVVDTDQREHIWLVLGEPDKSGANLLMADGSESKRVG